MKKIFYLSGMLLLFLGMQVFAQKESTTIKVRITDKNGELFEKEYENEDVMQADPALKELGVEVTVEDSGLTVRKKEGIQKISVVKEGGSNRMMIYQHGPSSDSARVPMASPPPMPPSPPGIENLAEEHQRMRERHDSLLSMHQEEREARIEEMRKRREEMRLRMENRREEMRLNGESINAPGKNSYTITIEELSVQDAARLGVKSNKLKLQDFQVKPSPQENVLRLSFRANSKSPVRIMLSNQDNILLLNETEALTGKSLDKRYELEGLQEGIYFLQIIQQNKVMGRKISIE